MAISTQLQQLLRTLLPDKGFKTAGSHRDAIIAGVEESKTYTDEKAAEKFGIKEAGKIVFLGNSYTEGYSLTGKHYFDRIAQFSDYQVRNYGRSGDDLLEIRMRMINNEPWWDDTSGIGVQDYGGTYFVIVCRDNNSALVADNSETYYQNAKKLIQIIKSLGGIPILSTEHQDFDNWYQSYRRLADEEGIMFMNFGKMSLNSFNNSYFQPFWWYYHPSTRTQALFSENMRHWLETLPRPRVGMKIFSEKSAFYTTADINQLLFEDNIGRAKLFNEIKTNASRIIKADEKYFDRLRPVSGGQWTGTTVPATTKDYDQYLQLQAGNIVDCKTNCLMEIIIPCTAQQLKWIRIHYNASYFGGCYIRKNVNLTNLPDPSRYIAFGIAENSSSLNVGDTFTVTSGTFDANLQATYTVSGITENMLYTTRSSSGLQTSGTDNPVTNIAGLTLLGSFNSASFEYMSTFEKPFVEWHHLTNANSNYVDIPTELFNDVVSFDKICLLLRYNQASHLRLSNPYVELQYQGEKPQLKKKDFKLAQGQSLLNNEKLDTGWIIVGSLPNVAQIESPDVAGAIESFPAGIAIVKEVDAENYLQQSLVYPASIDEYVGVKFQIRVLCRWFPTYVTNDALWTGHPLNGDKYDYGTLEVFINSTKGLFKAGSKPVGLYWHEVIFEGVGVELNSNDQVIIKGTNERPIQVARVKCNVME